MKRVLFVLLAVLFVSGFAFAEPEYIIDDTEGIVGGTFYIGSLGGPKTFNPAEAQETSSTDILNRMFMGMLDFDGDSAITGGDLASSYEVLENGNGWIFHIREGIKWSDGHPLTAEDVVWSFNNVYMVEGLITGNTIDVITDGDGNLPKVELVGDNSVLVEYPRPFAPGLRTIGSVQPLPKHILGDSAADGTISQKWTTADVAELVGNGPFIVTEYVEEERVVMSRNPHYYRYDTAGNQLPYFDQLVWVICQDQNTMRLKFEAGETDFLAVPADDYPAIKAQEADKDWIVRPYGPTTGTLFLALNFNSPNTIQQEWFRNIKFRQALSTAMDRDAMIDVIYNGLAQPQWGPISPASPFYDPIIEDYTYDFDLEAAKALLIEGGFSYNDEDKLVDADGNVVKFNLTTNAGNQVREKACNLMVDTFGQIGIEVVFNPIDFNTLVGALMNTGDWETLVIGLTGGADPHSGSNVSKITGGLHFWNYSPEAKDFINKDTYSISYSEWKIDEIFRKQSAEMDEDARYDMFSQYQVLAAENLPLIYTVQQLTMSAYPTYLKNVKIGGFSTWAWNVYELYKEAK